MTNLLGLISDNTGIDEEDLSAIIETAPERYKVFRIPKRTGGWRQIAHPARELKMIQRVLLDKFVSSLPIHAASTAYKKNNSIKDNALPHAGNLPILKMDFKQFFPSITADDWRQYCKENHVLDDEEIDLTASLFFWRPNRGKIHRLSIGAPTSPSLSNALMFTFDSIVSREAAMRGIAYTRFADDLTFSGQRIGMLKDMRKVVLDTCRKIQSPKLKINHDKTSFVTTAHRRTVTGVVLANDGTVGLGRDKRRELSKKVFHVQKGERNIYYLADLCGHLAFANVVEPEFIIKLERKYGAELINIIQSKTHIKRYDDCD